MTLPNTLAPTPRLLLGPGPSDAHPRVLAAMTTPLLGHLDPQYLAIMNETQVMLRQVFRTDNSLTFALPATGMAGMEACLLNLVEPGDKVLICAKGFFGQRMIEIAGRAGAEVTAIHQSWGKAFTLEMIQETLERLQPKVLGIVHAETSTGVRQKLDGLGELCQKHGTLLLMDCVTSLGCIPVEVDAWGVDAAYSCSQKGLGCPPGLSPVTFSKRAVDVIQARKTKVQSWYLDLNLLESYWNPPHAYHHTAPISMTYALREGLRIILEEGLEARWQRHEQNHQALKAGLLALGMQYTAEDGNQLPQLNAVLIPEGVDDIAGRKKLLNEFNIEIGGGLGDLKGKAWRIGLMGYNSKPSSVVYVLAALEQVLRQSGVNIIPGSGVAAAQEVYFQLAQ